MTTQTMQAAVLWEQGAPLSVEAVEIGTPGPGEVLVDVRAAGVCHSDLHPARGDWTVSTPVVLGHEGAGIVRAVGSHVTRVRPGDHVVLCWAPACGECLPCRAGRAVLCDRLERTNYRNRLPSRARHLHARGQPVAPFLGTACFADQVIVADAGVVPVSAAVPFEALATLGCAVVTGVGAVTNAARVPEGACVAVLGVGGVGLSVVQGARLARAEAIIAVDRSPAPLALARAFGATDVVESSAGVPEAVHDLTGGRGADFVFDTVGTSDTLTAAIAAAAKGGTVVITGLARLEELASFPLFPYVMQDKRLIGSVYGSADPVRDIQQLAEWYQEGTLELEALVTRTYPLDQINDALAALERGDGGRGVIRW